MQTFLQYNIHLQLLLKPTHLLKNLNRTLPKSKGTVEQHWISFLLWLQTTFITDLLAPLKVTGNSGESQEPQFFNWNFLRE